MKTPHAYQNHGAAYLALRRGAILGFQAGLGKTLTALLALQNLKAKRVLIVSPKSLKYWWAKEIQETEPGQVHVHDLGSQWEVEVWTPARKIRTYTLAHYEQFKDGKTVKVKNNRGKPKRKPSHLTVPYLNQDWDVVIADECQHIKNRKAQRTYWMGKLPAQYRWGLTGTPLAERPQDLWAILHWVAAQDFRSYWRFVNQYWDQETGFAGTRTFTKLAGLKWGFDGETGKYSPDVTLRLLQKQLEPYMLVKRLEDVGIELPPLTTTELPLEVDGSQREFYEQVKKDTVIELADDLGDPDVWDLSGTLDQLVINSVIARFTRLQQAASAPTVFRPELNNTKLDWLTDYADGNPPAVIMTRFNHTVDKINEVLAKAKRDDFTVGTYGKLAEGHNLQHYNQLIAWDAPQSRQQWEQAYHRIHRLGQDRPQQVIRLMADNTIDQHCWNLIENKEKAVREILEWLRGLH